jgi:selenocysteine lyase/cysteine desulfurase
MVAAWWKETGGTTYPSRSPGIGLAVTPVARCEVVGVDEPVPVLDGRFVPYVNLDNAASTPPLRSVLDAVERFLPFYASVHRGTGYKSRVSTAAYEQARDMVLDFVRADHDLDVAVFGKNTTEAINTLARSMSMPDDAVVLTTVLEHHSNDLPWRSRAEVVHVGARPDGTLDEDDLDRQLRGFAGRIALLAVSGASNVTGVVQPVHTLAEKVHAVGGRILVDAAQLAAHRSIAMGAHDDPGHLDFVVLSAHKMYAPFGTGALIGDRSCFGPAASHPGGGTVEAVSVDRVIWADLPDREEGGSPNVVGAVALGAATQALTAFGLDGIRAHEAGLTRYAIERLGRLPGLTLHGPPCASATADRVGVIPFSVDGLDHAFVAAVLGYEHGIGVRSGCFCAHPYVAHLLRLTPGEAGSWIAKVGEGDKRGAPGLVRMSLGCYSDRRDIDRAVEALERLVAGEVDGHYEQGLDGTYVPAGYHEPRLFDLARRVPPLWSRREARVLG